ncbi:MAG: type 3 dihydrofolate reductase [Enterobacterales bacterium]|nr:type 3 dihydrofolate reductase [Enterobacterales bacterium]
MTQNKKPSQIISLVVATAKNRVIGLNNKMPWHLPADLKHFKAVTMGKPIIMGRKTFESIGQALPGRRNLVISRNLDFKARGCEVLPSIEMALQATDSEPEVMVIGGGFLYQQMINQANRLYLTLIDLEIEGDTYFPEYESLNLTEISSESHAADEKNPYSYQFISYQVKQ